jgi:hypothetical protein
VQQSVELLELPARDSMVNELFRRWCKTAKKQTLKVKTEPDDAQSKIRQDFCTSAAQAMADDALDLPSKLSTDVANSDKPKLTNSCHKWFHKYLFHFIGEVNYSIASDCAPNSALNFSLPR